MKETIHRGTVHKLDQEVQDALNQTEPHDYYERLERIEALVKKLVAASGDIMILSRTAYNKGFSDGMSGDNYNSPYSTKDERSADYTFGFDAGTKELES
jgi:hypothetical protein